jgi:hypothetical protein
LGTVRGAGVIRSWLAASYCSRMRRCSAREREGRRGREKQGRNTGCSPGTLGHGQEWREGTTVKARPMTAAAGAVPQLGDTRISGEGSSGTRGTPHRFSSRVEDRDAEEMGIESAWSSAGGCSGLQVQLYKLYEINRLPILHTPSIHDLYHSTRKT